MPVTMIRPEAFAISVTALANGPARLDASAAANCVSPSISTRIVRAADGCTALCLGGLKAAAARGSDFCFSFSVIVRLAVSSNTSTRKE